MKHSEEGKWVYSTDDEIFRTNDYFDTKEEAIEEGKADLTWEGECPIFYVGKVKSVDTAININVDSIIDTLAEGVYEEVGEVAEDYLGDVKKEHYQELEDKLSDCIIEWMDKFGYSPNFFRVVSIEEIDSSFDEKTKE